MLDLLAAIQSADPPSLVLWSLFVFAAGMYPIGFMLGSSCSSCCGCKGPCTTTADCRPGCTCVNGQCSDSQPCDSCTTGSLPDTVTVTFDGFTDQTPGPDLIALSFSACFGGGASARVTAPGGDPDTDKGPISAVSLTNAGSGYAKLGRVAPTISVSGGSGEGATFTPTITSSNDACGVPSWSIASVAVKDGTGYVDGEQLTVSVIEGDTVAADATVVVNTTRTEPTLTASASPGSGAVLAVTLSANYGSPSTWGVASVLVTSGGTGYTDGDNLTFTGGAATKVGEAASAYIRTGRVIPTLTGSVGGSGSSAAVTPILTEYAYYGPSYWSVTGFTITNGGSGYAEYDPVSVAVTDGTSGYFSYFYAYVSSVDENGAITGIAIDWGGEFYKDTGVIESVELWWGGAYYDDDGVPTGVTVTNGGQYYREDASETPYVADVTISITQTAPSDGAGAEIAATVDDDTSSPTFGRITGLTIENGGDGYLAWQWRNTKCCGDYYNGLSVVLRRNGCSYTHDMCGAGNIRTRPGRITATYNGPASPMTINVVSEESNELSSRSCNTLLTASSVVSDCSTLQPDDDSELVFSSGGGATATLSVGGEYDSTFRNPGGASCFICCKGDGLYPDEIEIEIASESREGVYVLQRNSLFSSAGIWIAFTYGVGQSWTAVVYHWVCSTQDRDGFSPDAIDGCDECHKKCKTVVITSDGNADPNGCDSCSETPQCRPSAGTYTIAGQYSVIVV